MLYQLYQSYADGLAPFQSMAASFGDAFARPWLGLPQTALQRSVMAACQLFAEGRLQHHRPEFGIDRVAIGNSTVPVTEEKVRVTPFSTLLHFKKETAHPQPRVLLVAPMSGHFATLLRHTVRTMLPENDIYITDWHNARDVPLSAGDFDFDDFIDHIIQCLEVLGEGSHVVAVCQPVVAVLAAVALMAQSGNPCQPRSMTLMAGPIDTRIKPTKVDDLAMEHPIEWFEANLIQRVPAQHPGAYRRVYPGFLQIAAFMAMNLERHIRAFARQFDNVIDENEKGSVAHRAFYEEYFAVMDLTASFYLQTVDRIFRKHELARGVLVSRGRKVEPVAIRRTALLTVEGENDDICSIGQTLAAQELCTSILPIRRNHHLQTGVGHYGVFSGRRWANEVYPRVRHIIQANS
ncbi:MAG TPA: polyhydroxyalkanoate depolymerase [Stellaceae bacterium]|nr:polyhydroxyalkanoate depolymerase [Stellaceae bacterium]